MALFRQRKFWLPAGLLAAAAAGAAAYATAPWPSLLNVFFDILAFFAALACTLALISQIVLPVQSMGDRREALEHFFNFVVGQAGPVLFVRDGQLFATKAELRRYGHGVALVDSVSAVVLEQAAARGRRAWTGDTDGASRAARGETAGPPLVRAAGPGIVFIRPGEHIVKTLDLRRQSRGRMVAALTGDGIECQAYVSVTFGLDPYPDREPGSQAPAGERIMPTEPFNAHSAFRAVYGMARGEQQPVEWTDLPLEVAAECVRIVLAEYSLDHLVQPNQPHSSRLNEFKDKINSTVKGAPVLRERGIAVYSVGVSDLVLPREVVNQRVRVWQAQWQKVTIDREAAAEKQAISTLQDRRRETQAELLAELNQLLGANPDPLAREALWRILVKSLQRASGDPLPRPKPAAEGQRAASAVEDRS